MEVVYMATRTWDIHPQHAQIIYLTHHNVPHHETTDKTSRNEIHGKIQFTRPDFKTILYYNKVEHTWIH